MSISRDPYLIDSHSSMSKFLGSHPRVFDPSHNRQLLPSSVPKCLSVFKVQPLPWTTLPKKLTEKLN